MVLKGKLIVGTKQVKKSRPETRILLESNAKMTVDAAFDILEVSEKEREMILKML